MQQEPLQDSQTTPPAAIAYLTFIPAIIFLVVEPYNKNSYVTLPRLAVHLPLHCRDWVGIGLGIVLAIAR